MIDYLIFLFWFHFCNNICKYFFFLKGKGPALEKKGVGGIRDKFQGSWTSEDEDISNIDGLHLINDVEEKPV